MLYDGDKWTSENQETNRSGESINPPISDDSQGGIHRKSNHAHSYGERRECQLHQR